MEALGLLPGQLSPDFNNLLTIIIGSMELVMAELPKESPGMKLAQGILKTSKESANLIKQLLIFARRQEAEPVLVNLNDIIAETRVLLDRLLGVNIKMEYSFAPDLVEVNMTPEQFKQVLINLVINAKDAMPAGGVIKIRTFQPARAQSAAHAAKAAEYAAFEISTRAPASPGIRSTSLRRSLPQTQGQRHRPGPVHGLRHNTAAQRRHPSGIRARKASAFTIRIPKAADPTHKNKGRMVHGTREK